MNYSVIKELHKQEEALQSDNAWRKLKALEVGNYKISVQGSEGHYCDPRITLPVQEYNEMEIALFKDNNWMSPDDEDLKGFKRYNELIKRADGMSGCTVYGYVQIDLINDLYLYLKDK